MCGTTRKSESSIATPQLNPLNSSGGQAQPSTETIISSQSQPQVVAGGQTGTMTLTDIPDDIRKRLRISRQDPALNAVAQWVNYFIPGSNVKRIATLGNITVKLGNGTDQQNKENFENIVSDMIIAPSNPTQQNDIILPADTIIDVAIVGGPNAIFRFTRYTESNKDNVLIEKTKDLTPIASNTATIALTGKVKVNGIEIDIPNTFSQDYSSQLVNALKLIPEPILQKADGVKFSYMGPGAGPNNAVGQYNPNTDTIEIWQKMFDATARRIGTGTNIQDAIIHEVGHCIDLRPRYANLHNYNKANERLKNLEMQRNNLKSNDPLDLEPPDGAAKLDADIAKAKKDVKNLKKGKDIMLNSFSGYRDGIALQNQLADEFGRALNLDGVKVNQGNLTGGVTDYANKDLMEAFAENFSIYILDESLLQLIRPNTCAFFRSKLPKTLPTP